VSCVCRVSYDKFVVLCCVVLCCVVLCCVVLCCVVLCCVVLCCVVACVLDVEKVSLCDIPLNVNNRHQ